MERVNENVAWSSRDMMDMASYSNDGFDIIGEGKIDDAEEEPHLETLLPFVIWSLLLSVPGFPN